MFIPSNILLLLLLLHFSVTQQQQQQPVSELYRSCSSTNDNILVEGDMYVLSTCCQCTVDLGYPAVHDLDLETVVSDESVVQVLNVTSSIVNINCSGIGAKRLCADVTLRALFLGRTTINIVSKPSDDVISVGSITVLRQQRALDTIFTVSTAVLVALNTIVYTCTLDWKTIVEYLKHPLGVVIGFSCQYLIMPLAAFGLSKAFALPNSLAFGLLCYGSSPGGGMSNVWTILLRGDLNLSVCMTVVSTIASIGMTPLWVFTLGRLFTKNIVVPFEHIFLTLASLVVTCIIGLLIGRFLPRVSRILVKLIKPIAFLIIVYVLTVGTYTNLYMFRLMGTWRLALGATLVSYVGFAVSLCVARFIFKRTWKVVRTIVIETGIQHGGVALVMVRYSLQQPDGDLASVAPVMAMMTCSAPLIVVWIVWTLKDRCCSSSKSSTEDTSHSQQLGVDNEAAETGEGAKDMPHANGDVTTDGVSSRPWTSDSSNNFSFNSLALTTVGRYKYLHETSI